MAGKNQGKVTTDPLLKVPPHNMEAEQAVLGAVLLRNDVLIDLLDILSPVDFYTSVHAKIFEVYLDMFATNTPIDLITLQAALEKKKALNDVGGAVYLAELVGGIVAPSNAVFYARMVRDTSVERQLLNASSGIISSIFSGHGDVGELLDRSEQAIFDINERRAQKGISGSRELLQRVVSRVHDLQAHTGSITGLRTGFCDLDALTSGLQPTDLIVVAGRPSMGKTAFALNVGSHAAAEEKSPVAIFSLEMGEEQLMMRILCARARVNFRHMRSGTLNEEALVRFHDAVNALDGVKIFIDDTPSITPLELRARCRRLKREHGLGLAIVDYLQLMQSSKRTDSREQEISDISRNLKALAKELKIPVVALSQLNRKVEDRTDKRPRLADLRESGAIEQDADLIMFLYRDDVYKAKGATPDNKAEVIVGKHRNGPTGTVELFFDSEFTAFRNLSRNR